MSRKLKRIVDAKLLAFVRKLPCLMCSGASQKNSTYALRRIDEVMQGLAQDSISHPHHVKSRGAGGHDIASNVMPLCEMCHQIIHRVGLTQAAEKFPIIRTWLQDCGWSFDPIQKRWKSPKPEIN